MATENEIVRHFIGGGWATAYGPSAEVSVSAGRVVVPFLAEAENVEYLLDGGAQKIGGVNNLNASALESGATVYGGYDYWRMGSAGSPVQKRLIYIGTKLKKDDADGSFSDIVTGLTAGQVASFDTFGDLAIISFSGTDVPRKYDQTSAATLGTNTPNFAFGVRHRNRFWAAGVVAESSRLYYSQHIDDGGADGDWDGSGSGFIDIDPEDGDKIMGLASHRNQLFVFKGPYRGSIHRIAGSAPTGSDGFAKLGYLDRGLPCCGHNTIFHFRDDIGFMTSDGSIHSLNAVESFGDFTETALSRPIDDWLREHINPNQLQRAQAVTISQKGGVCFAIPIDSASFPNVLLWLDYRFDPPRWAKWPAFDDYASIFHVVDSSRGNRQRIFSGGKATGDGGTSGFGGFVWKLGEENRSINDTTTYLGRIALPFLTYTGGYRRKVLYALGAGMRPGGSYGILMSWQADDELAQVVSITQGAGGDVLAPATGGASEFTLGTSTLGGSRFIEQMQTVPEGGEFSSIQFQAANGGLNQTMQVHSITAEMEIGALSTEEA